MSEYLTDVSEQKKELDHIVRKARKFLVSAPEGVLYVGRSGKTFQYHVRQASQGKNGVYLKKKDIEKARALAQKDYCQRLLESAEAVYADFDLLERIHACRSISFMYSALAEVYSSMPPGKRELVEPYVLPDEAYIQKWLSAPASSLGFKDGAAEIYTERGERVRSKSEKMIADKLYMLGVPYRYESTTLLDDGTMVCPDYMILDISERKEILFEHFGMMGDEDYENKALAKIETYTRNGYEVGRSFLYTMETTERPLDMRHFERMIRSRLGMAGKVKGRIW